VLGWAGDEWSASTGNEHQPVGKGKHAFQPVFCHQHGQTQIVHESGQSIEHFFGRGGIEGGGRFVEHQDPWGRREHGADRHPLLLPTRERPQRSRSQILDPEQVDGVFDATTHRFESGYTASLVGPLPEARDVYLANSAITHAAKIRAAVLLLHGADDKVVVPAQSAAVDQILQRTGTHVERVVYDGEGHGWRNAATIADELARVEAFLARWC